MWLLLTRTQEPEFPTGLSEQAKDLLRKMLEKNPCMRITMSEIKRHPWLRAYEFSLTDISFSFFLFSNTDYSQR
jgi:serine/threonine protein kinase